MPVATVEVPIEVNGDGVWMMQGTRVPLDTVAGAFRDGASAEEIVLQYPSLSLPDVYSILGYCLQNQEEVDEYLERREGESAMVRRKIEARFPQDGIRARLLMRKARRGE